MTTIQRTSLLIVLIVLLAGGGVFAWMKYKPTTSNTNHVTRTNSNTTSTTNSASNTNTITPDNTNTSSAASNITVAQALSNPEQYNGQPVCITGHYEQSYDVSAFGINTKPGSQELAAPSIWVYPIVPTSKLQCTKNPTTKRTSCYGDVTVCSVFVYKPNGGIGHGGTFTTALDAAATVQ